VNQPTLIIQLPAGGALERQLSAEPPPSLAGNEVVVEVGTTDAQGNLNPPASGEVVLSVLSPEALAREVQEVRRVIAHAGAGVEPLVVVVEAAEELREEELAGVLEAARHASRPVILRVVRNV
jgi:hypothetical protein